MLPETETWMRPDEVISAWVTRFLRRRDGAAQPNPAAAVGALGEALVAGALREMGWPTLRNVVLRERDASAELDILVRAPSAIVVLEVKTWSGFIEGAARAEQWIRYGAGGQQVGVPNAVRQNLAHVTMAERAIGDREVAVFGLVVSAGRGRYATSLQAHVVPLADLPDVLRTHSGRREPGSPSALDRAWTLMAREAEKSEARRAPHAAWVRSRRSHRRYFE
jgi:Nuclease-related domain